METPKQTLLLARWVCPMDQPPIANGGVVFGGERILAIGEANDLRERFFNAVVVNYGWAALLPGLINAHTHLELTNRPRIDFEGDVVEWLLSQRPTAGLTPEQHRVEVETATRVGIQQCLQFGVTCIGDISQQCQWTRPALAASPLRATSFGEVLGLGKLRSRTQAMRERAMDLSAATSKLRIGISPHSPYTLEWTEVHECSLEASKYQVPLAIHLAEWPAERDFLLNEAGPFREMWERLGLWDKQVQLLHKPPILLATTAQMLKQKALLAHVNDVTDVELEFLAAGVASVIFCPRTHAYFRHPPHRCRDMLAAGINVAVGTDSCASSPDLNIVDDLRLLHQQNRSVPIGLLWHLVTTHAARAMSMENDLGSLTPSKFADLSVFPVSGNDPLREILDSSVEPLATWIGGELVNGSAA